MNKRDTVEKYGQEQVQIWRRSYETRPPAMDKTDKRNPVFDLRYAQLKNEILPSTECLEDTLNRVLPYWHEVIEPVLKDGKQIIVAAHGNSLRALVKYLDKRMEYSIRKLTKVLHDMRIFFSSSSLNGEKHVQRLL